MPFNPNEIDDQSGGEEPLFEQVSDDQYNQNDNRSPSGDWQIDDPETVTMGTRAPVTTIKRGDGRPTIRTNYDIAFNTGNFIFGHFSGTFKKGCTLEGRDSNNNGIPDIMEKGWRYHEMWIVNP